MIPQALYKSEIEFYKDALNICYERILINDFSDYCVLVRFSDLDYDEVRTLVNNWMEERNITFESYNNKNAVFFEDDFIELVESQSVITIALTNEEFKRRLEKLGSYYEYCVSI